MPVDEHSKENIINTKNNQSNTEENNISPLFEEFLKLCILCENSYDMQYIVEMILKSAYSKADNDYINSKAFNNVLRNAINTICNEQGKVFTYINKIIKNLKGNVKKRKVELITLDCNLASSKKKFFNKFDILI